MLAGVVVPDKQWRAMIDFKWFQDPPLVNEKLKSLLHQRPMQLVVLHLSCCSFTSGLLLLRFALQLHLEPVSGAYSRPA